jgi:phosphoribosylformimino-5-aminoimidazole carboxamide ribotide isomerase
MVQLGGGIRHRKAVDFWLERGVKRVVLGTAAVKDPDFVKEACIDHPGHVAVGIDAKEGIVKIEGWTESAEMKTLDVARRFEDSGVSAIIYTDIARDGVMKGPNIEATMELANAVSVPVVASGGISSMADLEALKTASAGKLQGAIIGRALYEKSIDPAAALKLLES